MKFNFSKSKLNLEKYSNSKIKNLVENEPLEYDKNVELIILI